MATHALEDVKTWRDAKVVDNDGDKVGKVNDIYLDRQTGEPAWIAINTGLFGMKVSFAPIAGATRRGDDIVLACDKDSVKDAPNVDADGELSPREEQALYSHYGRDWGQWDNSSPDRTEGILGRDERFARDDAERARLRRYAETDPVRDDVR